MTHLYPSSVLLLFKHWSWASLSCGAHQDWEAEANFELMISQAQFLLG